MFIIAIAGVPIAFPILAVERFREAARRIECTNSIEQIDTTKHRDRNAFRFVAAFFTVTLLLVGSD